MDKVELYEAVARGYCHEKNAKKNVDADLLDAIVAEVDKIDKSPNLGCATTEMLIDEIKARVKMDGKLGYRTIDE